MVNLPVDGENILWQWGKFLAALNTATPLQIAAFFGRTQIATSLVNQGCRVNSVDAGGRTALHFAAANGNAQTVELLLASGANVESIDAYGSTPLMVAAMRCHVGALEALVKGVDLDVRDYLNRTVYHHAAEACNFAGLAFLLTTTTGWDLASESAEGQSVLVIAL